MNANNTNDYSDYVVVARTSSGVRFKSNEYLKIKGFPSIFGKLNLVFFTRYSEEGHEIPIPRELSSPLN